MNATGEATVAFAAHGRTSAALLVRPRPAVNGEYAVYCGQRESPTVFVHRRALGQLRDNALAALPNETIGVLLGRPCRDEGGEYAIVEAALAASSAEHAGSMQAVQISSTGRSALHRRAMQRHPVLESVGWWHSHPLGPPRYSQVDREEQATFPRVYHVGIVVAAERYASEDDHREPDPLGVYVGPRALRLERVHREGPAFERAHEPTDRPAAPPGAKPLRERDGAVGAATYSGVDPALRQLLLQGRRQAIALAGALLAAIVAATVWLSWEIGDITRPAGGLGTSNPEVQRDPTGSAPAVDRWTPVEVPPWQTDGDGR